MEILKKIISKMQGSASTLLLLLSLLDFLTYYIINLAFWQYEAADYVSYFLGRFFELAIPIAMAALLILKERTILGAIGKAILFSLTRLIYLLPYYYLRHVYDIYDSIEAISIAIPLSLLHTLIIAAKVLMLYAIISLFIRKRCATREEIYPIKIFDLDNPAVLGIMVCSLIPFTVETGLEIYSTVKFFIEVGTRYKTEDIIFYAGSFAFLIASFLIINLLAVLFIKRIKKRLREDEK